MEENEKPQDALRREVKEELGAEVKSLELVSAISTPLEAKDVKYLAFRMVFLAQLKKNKITLSHEHSGYQWIKPDDISSLKLLPGTSEAVSC